MDEITKIEFRLKLIHNETACTILQKMIEEKKEPEVFSLEEIRLLTKIKESTLLINLKSLVDEAFLQRSSRGTYELTFEGKNIISIIRELGKRDHLDLIRKYKRPEMIFLPLFSSKGSFSISDLMEHNLSRASAYRILNELTSLDYLIKKENKTWGLSRKFEELKNILLQKKELTSEILKEMDELQEYLRKKYPNISIVLSSNEGLLIYPEIDENLEYYRISSVASAEVNIGNTLERVTESNILGSSLNLILNKTMDGFSLIRAYRELILILLVKNSKDLDDISSMLTMLPSIDKKMKPIRENF